MIRLILLSLLGQSLICFFLFRCYFDQRFLFHRNDLLALGYLHLVVLFREPGTWLSVALL